MRKTMKSIISVVFAIAMLIGMMPAGALASETDTTPAPTLTAEDTSSDTAEATAAPTAAADTAATEWTAMLMYSSAKPDDKSWQIFKAEEKGAKNTVKFIGDGVYEVSIKASDIGATVAADTAQVLCVDILDFGKVMLDAGKNINNYTDDAASHDITKHYQPTDLTINVEVYVDGKAVPCKQNKYNYGNIEDQGGNFRIELYNEWGLHNACVKDNPPVNPLAILPKEEIKVVFSIQGTGFNTEDGAKQITDYQASKVTPTVAAAPTEAAAEADSSDAASTEASNEASAEDGNNTGIIIGIAAAAAVVLIAVIIIVMRRNKK